MSGALGSPRPQELQRWFGRSCRMGSGSARSSLLCHQRSLPSVAALGHLCSVKLVVGTGRGGFTEGIERFPGCPVTSRRSHQGGRFSRAGSGDATILLSPAAPPVRSRSAMPGSVPRICGPSPFPALQPLVLLLPPPIKTNKQKSQQHMAETTHICKSTYFSRWISRCGSP